MTSRAHPPFILKRNPQQRGQWFARDEADGAIALIDGQGRINFYTTLLDVALVKSLIHCAELVSGQWDEDSPLFGVNDLTINRRPTSEGVDLSEELQDERALLQRGEQVANAYRPAPSAWPEPGYARSE